LELKAVPYSGEENKKEGIIWLINKDNLEGFDWGEMEN